MLRTLTRLAAPAVVISALAVPAAQAQADDADRILKAMSDFMASQRNIEVWYDSDIEVITPELQKIQFTSSGHLLLSRPDKLRAERTGGYADVGLVSNGKTLTVYGKHVNGYVQLDAPGPIDHTIDELRAKFAVAIPGADLLQSNPYEVLTSGVIKSLHVGRGVVGGVECEHLAFRGQDTDWQIWVQVGDHPIPRKYVITSKATAAAPQYTLVVKDFKTNVQPASDTFAFTPPPGARKLDPRELAHFDEVPPPTPPSMERQ